MDIFFLGKKYLTKSKKRKVASKQPFFIYLLAIIFFSAYNRTVKKRKDKEMESKEVTILVKYHDDIEHIAEIKGGDWFDLRAAEDVYLEFMESALISLGVSIQLPEGYEAHVVPRSSTFKKWGIIQTNSMGIIDCSYCGDNDIWRMPVLCLRKEGTVIKKGDRICQFRIMENQPDIHLVEVKHLGNEDRGGFGSTGTK